MKYKNNTNPFISLLKASEESLRLMVKYENHLQSFDFSKHDSLGIYIFKFNYITDNYKSCCQLPLSEPLPKINFVSPLANNPQHIPYKTFLKAMQNPIIGVALVIAAGAMAYLQATNLTISLLCIGVASSAYVAMSILRKKLIARFDIIEQEVKQKKYTDYDKLKKIPFIYKIILHAYFPGNKDLKWRYHYLNSLSKERWGGGFKPEWSAYNAALEYSETEEQRFLCLRGIINSAALWHKGVKIKVSYEEIIQPYVAQISSASKQHQELEDELRNKVYSCRNTLLARNYLGAIHEFYKIAFDAYAKEAYPDIALLYCQIDAILILIGKDHPSMLSNFDSDGMRLCDAYDTLTLINQKYICKFYPDKNPLYSDFLLNFDNFRNELPTEYNPRPGKHPTTPENQHVTIVELNSDDKAEPQLYSPKQHAKLKI